MTPKLETTQYKNVGLVASTDKDRPAMNGILLTKNRAVATDGYCLVSVPIKFNGVADGEKVDEVKPTIIPKEAWKDLHATKKGQPKQLHLTKGDQIVLEAENVSTQHKAIKETFPPFEKITEKLESDNFMTITFRMRYLNNIAKALNAEQVTMRIYPDESMLRIESYYPYQGDDSWGLLMTVRDRGYEHKNLSGWNYRIRMKIEMQTKYLTEQRRFLEASTNDADTEMLMERIDKAKSEIKELKSKLINFR